MTAAVAEVLTHRARRIWRDIQERRRIGGTGRNNDAVPERVGFFENPDDLGNRRLLLPDRVVDTDDVLVALIDDRVDSHRRFAGLPIADDQLALSAADRHHRVNSFQAGLQRFPHRLPIDDPGRDTLDRHEGLRGNRTFAVDGLAERIHDAPQQFFADGHRDNAPRALHDVAFPDLRVLAKEHGAYTVFFQVQRDAEYPVRELEHLAGHRTLDAMDPCDAIAERNDAADFRDVHLDGVAANLLADDLRNFFSFDIHSL